MILKKVLIVITTIIAVNPCESGSILAIMPTPSYSHQIVFNPLWLSLNSRGHHITLFTTDPIKNSNLSNFRQVDWSSAYKLWHEKYNISTIIVNFKNNFIKCLKQYIDMMEEIFIRELEHPEVRNILNNPNEHFDLIIVEVLNPLMIAFSKRFNCPVIGVSPMDVTNFVHDAMHHPVSPALYPDFLSTFDDNMNFWERTVNVFYSLGTHLYIKCYLYPRMDHIVGKYFGKNTPTIEEMQRNITMLFINVNPIIHNVRPFMRHVLMIGGGTHFEGSGTLPPDIQKFLDDAEAGAIYFSLGTNVKSKDLSEEIKSVFLEVFSELPYKVLWKFENMNISTNSNVMIKRWMPQQQILKHKNIKLFITQGGLQSIEEAIFNEIPIIGMPAYVDQFSNVKRVVRKGLGIMLDSLEVEKLTLKNAIKQVVIDSKYKNAAKKLSILLKEQPLSGISQAVWWTEYVLKHKGAKFLKSPEIPLYQYLLLDVALFLFLVMGVLTTLLLIVLKFIKICMNKKRRGKVVKLE